MVVLYGKILNVSSGNIDDPNRDRFILSKGHVVVGYYATFAELRMLKFHLTNK
jgi:transketolase